MVWYYIILIVVGIGILASLVFAPQILKINSKKALIDSKSLIDKRNSQLELYGELTKEIKWGSFPWGSFPHAGEILCFEGSGTIILDEKPYSFSDLINVDLVKDNTVIYTTKTSTSSMLGRAVVGGALFGGVGAIIGGSTAKSGTVSDSSYSLYSLYINLNSLTTPQICIEFAVYEKEAREAVALLSIILNRTNSSAITN